MKSQLALVIITICLYIPSLCGCALTYSTDGKNRSLNYGFTPTIQDYKAIKELAR